jgi:alkanesulfonate monooxygenase SsuD/methylene tetrahydromethanopterin reductase-like flavin-dependent oxidoreductase (luciferase family)
MRYGLTLPIAGPCGDVRFLAEIAHLAEAAGWDGVFLEDYIVHHFAPGLLPVCDPWIALTAMALATRRIRLGTSVTPLSRRRPWKVAREMATLDHLSDGRMIFGVGIGDLGDWGFARVSEVTDDKQRAERLDEALDVIAGLWRGEPFSYRGNHYQVRDLTMVPAPLQKPRIPIWIGGAWPHRRPALRASRWDGFVSYRVYPDGSQSALGTDDIAAIRKLIDANRSASTPFDLCAGGYPRGDDLASYRRQLEEAAAAGVTWWNEYVVGPADDVRAIIGAGPPV